jgi:hypothetical protein
MWDVALMFSANMKYSWLIIASVSLALLGSCSSPRSESELQSGGRGSLLDRVMQGTVGFEDEPSWPKPPRNADIYSNTIDREHTLTAMLSTDQIPGVNLLVTAGPKVEWSISTKVTATTFVVATNKDEYNQKSNQQRLPLQPTNDLFVEVAPNVVVANTWKGTRDMVYFCHYTLAREDASSTYGELKILKSGTMHGLKSTDKLEVQYMSRFHRVTANDSLSSLKEVCSKKYRDDGIDEEMRRRLETNFKDVYVYSSATSCFVDAHCQASHRIGFPGVPDRTVSRCVNVANKAFVCQRFSKEGEKCPLFRTDANGEQSRLTKGEFEFPCDKGLQCRETLGAGHFAGFKYSSAEAVCMKAD